MSDMKCPICGGKLHVFPKENSIVCVPCGFDGNEKLWQELIRTRKALDCAINTLDTVYGLSEDNSNIETYIKCKRIEINRIIKGGKDE